MTSGAPDPALPQESPALALPAPQESLPARVLALLRGGPLSGRGVAAGLGLRWSVVFRVLAELVEAGRVVREGRGRSSRFRLVGSELEEEERAGASLPGASSARSTSASGPGLPGSAPPSAARSVYCGRTGPRHPARATATCAWCQTLARVAGVELEEEP